MTSIRTIGRRCAWALHIGLVTLLASCTLPRSEEQPAVIDTSEPSPDVTAAVIGGLGNVYGAMFGGYVLAIVEVLIVALVPEGSRYKDVGVFLLLILVLVFRPSGLIRAAPQKMG